MSRFPEKQIAMEWLKDAAKEAREDDPSVGVFANEYLAATFDQLASILEDDAEPTGGYVVTRRTDRAVWYRTSGELGGLAWTKNLKEALFFVRETDAERVSAEADMVEYASF